MSHDRASEAREAVAAPTLPDIENLVRTLAGVMHAQGVTEIDLASGGLTLRLRAPRSTSDGQVLPNGNVQQDGIGAPNQPPTAPGLFIKAPMIGTFYSAPSPSSPPYVHVGDVIAAGQVIGIIEAMKIMNEITSDHDGVVADLLVQNGEPVEYGTSLVRLEPGGSARR